MARYMTFLSIIALTTSNLVAAQSSTTPSSMTTPSTAAAKPAGSSPAAKSPSAYITPASAYIDNERFAHYLLVILAALTVTLAIYRSIIYCVRYIRTLTCLNNDRQFYFRLPQLTFASFKENLLYAPLFSHRHNKEMRLIRGWNIGILPTRFQSLLLLGIVTMNVVLCVKGIEWRQGGTSAMLLHLRNRTGTMSIINMIPLVLISGRTNPLIKLFGISFDTFNLMHRWFGRIVAAEALVHAIAWTINTVHSGGWKAVHSALMNSAVIYTGFIGTVATVAILIQASSVIRHAFYETFLHLHIALAILTIVGLWYHIPADGHIYIKVVVFAWAAERALRFSIFIYRNVGRNGGTKAVIEHLPGEAVRVTLHLARPWVFKPGQHAYLTIPSIGLWTSHPFSAAWSNSTDGTAIRSHSFTTNAGDEKGSSLVMNRQDVLALHQKSISFVLRRRDGFTNSLYRKAAESPSGRLVMNAFAEGPYGGYKSLDSYGTVLLFAGGVGITHQVPFVRSLVAGFANGTCAARRVTLVWIIQSPEHLEWIRPWMTEILALDQRRDVLRIQLFVTRPRSTKEIHSPSATVQMFPGRPNVDTLVGLEAESQVGAMGVSVCGPGELSDAVRAAVRRRQGERNIDLLEECFTW
ncbi:hypothetical protein MMC25_000673 [Agyrium rufum]|nr:hypothetical protein [Agyrium rufum]